MSPLPRPLTYLQRRAAVLLAQGMRPADVARDVHISRATMYRWRTLPHFQAFVATCASPCPGTGVPGWLVTMLQSATQPLAWTLEDLIRHGNHKSLALTLNTLQRCPLPEHPHPAVIADVAALRAWIAALGPDGARRIADIVLEAPRDPAPLLSDREASPRIPEAIVRQS